MQPNFFFLFFFLEHRIPPGMTHIMPSFFSTAVAFLLFWVMTSIIITTTTTIVVVATPMTTPIGGTNALSLMRKIKNSKKTNANANKDKTCTMEPFLGTSMYTNCKKKETEVKIACATTDDTTIVSNTTPTTTTLCSYSERPVQYEHAPPATTAAGCGDHGSFDPETHLSMDHTTGMCCLKFVRLTSTCIGVPARSGFGVMVEVQPRTGPHHHTPNEDNHHKDNSGMLLRFSHDAGVTYYNKKDPRYTVPVDTSRPRFLSDDGKFHCARTPVSKYVWDTGKWHPLFHEISTTTDWWGEDKAFQTCYQKGNEKTYCWSMSNKSGNTHYECRPDGDGAEGWTGIEDIGWHAVHPQYVYPFAYTCGEECPNTYRSDSFYPNLNYCGR